MHVGIEFVGAAEGELEIGQVSGMIHEVRPAGEIVAEIVRDFNLAIGRLGDWTIFCWWDNITSTKKFCP